MGGDAVVSVSSAAQLADILRQRQAEGCVELFAERFVEGREFNISVLGGGPDGPRVLPAAEIDFAAYPPGMPRIVDYRAKWVEDSFEYAHTVRHFPSGGADASLAADLAEISLRTWHLLGLAGWARIDFRVDRDGRPWVLEVNPNPCLAPDAGFVAATSQAGLSPAQVVESILVDALSRHGARGGESATAEHVPAVTGTPRVSSPRLSRNGFALREEPMADDPERVRELIASTGFFHSHEIPVAVELVEDRLAKGAGSDYSLLFAECDGRLAGYTCYGEIACTEGSYDLYWIAVHPDFQGRGLGRELLRETEARVRARGGARVYIETSGRPLYESTRGFYERCDYRLEATLEGFYGLGDAKLIYSRAL
jgi:ribosomal protein S18 acetylase RimI-like enzyme